MSSREAVVCAGDAGINALATIRSLGRRGVPVHAVALKASAQIATASRYCASRTLVDEPGALLAALCELAQARPRPPLLYVDNDPMLRQLAPHAAALARRFELADPIERAEKLTDKAYQLGVAAECGIAVPRSWFPASWPELGAIGRDTRKRLIAKPRERAGFKALVAASAAELAEMLRAFGAAPQEVLVQEFIEGDDAQLYAGLCYRARRPARAFTLCARKLRQTQPGAGVMAVGRVVSAPLVRELTRRLAAALELRGTLCTEFKLDPTDGRLYFIEWNPRPAYVQSIGWKCGFDLAWLAWCDHFDPQRLPRAGQAAPGRHYWINLQGDLAHLAKAPGLALRPGTWLPYVRPKQWAVLALDDPRPWLKAMRALVRWLGAGLRARCARLGAAARAARPTSAT
jgi:predicted ATP-grasp superfamily ATP-dependent carboligase